MERTKESIPEIVDAIVKVTNIPRIVLLSKNRKREIVQIRQLAMYLAKKYTNATLKEIGRVIGGKDHATAIHACDTIQDLKDTDRSLKERFEQIESQVLIILEGCEIVCSKCGSPDVFVKAWINPYTGEKIKEKIKNETDIYCGKCKHFGKSITLNEFLINDAEHSMAALSNRL